MESPKQSPASNQSLSFFKNVLLVTGGGVALIVVLTTIGIWQTGNRLLAGISHLFNAPPSAPQVNVPTLVINQVRGASELTTAVFTMEAVVPTSQDRKLGEIAIATTKLLYIAQGEVKAGIDLSALNASDVEVQDNIVNIQLPPPQILDSKIDVERSKVYDYNRGFLNLGPDVAPQLQTLAQRQTLQKIVDTACTKGILAEANDRAKLTVTQLLMTAGYEKVEVETALPSTEACSAQS